MSLQIKRGASIPSDLKAGEPFFKNAESLAIGNGDGSFKEFMPGSGATETSELIEWVSGDSEPVVNADYKLGIFIEGSTHLVSIFSVGLKTVARIEAFSKTVLNQLDPNYEIIQIIDSESYYYLLCSSLSGLSVFRYSASGYLDHSYRVSLDGNSSKLLCATDDFVFFTENVADVENHIYRIDSGVFNTSFSVSLGSGSSCLSMFFDSSDNTWLISGRNRIDSTDFPFVKKIDSEGVFDDLYAAPSNLIDSDFILLGSFVDGLFVVLSSTGTRFFSILDNSYIYSSSKQLSSWPILIDSSFVFVSNSELSDLCIVNPSLSSESVYSLGASVSSDFSGSGLCPVRFVPSETNPLNGLFLISMSDGSIKIISLDSGVFSDFDSISDVYSSGIAIFSDGVALLSNTLFFDTVNFQTVLASDYHFVRTGYYSGSLDSISNITVSEGKIVSVTSGGLFG
jgi:hypothetical protein